MTENRDEINNGNGPDIKTRYEFLIAGLVVVVLCIVAFVTFRITSYINGAQVTDNTVSTLDMSDGTLLIEVEIKDSESDPSGDASDPSASDSDDAQATLNEHDDIEVFITAKEGDDFYKSKEGRLKLYVEPKETDDDRPALVETVPFRVLGFSRDGWAAIVFGGTRYYVKSSDIVKTDVPDDAPEYVAPEDSQGIRFFAPVEGDGEEYVATMNTVAFSLPDVQSSGNKVNLKEGEVVKVVAVGGDWYKIDYMNAEYYVLSYLTPKNAYAD
ncbi:MAG: hypothetical protein IKM96_05675 [Clostridiales bacterium]|nr:hypothetical protein [Clostridiales bacterium]